MDATTVITISSIISLVLSTTAAIFSHSLVVREVRKLTRELEDIKLINQTILQEQVYHLENRRKAEMVAEYFALWNQSAPMEYAGQDGSMSIREFTPNDFKRLNELSYQCAFWLPQNILNDINDRIGNVQGAKDVKQIIVDVRTFLDVNAGVVDWRTIRHF